MRNLKSRLLKEVHGASKILVLGVGSELRGDDAAGMLAAEALKVLPPPFKVPFQVIAGSTAPENFTGEIKRFSPSHVLIIDTIQAGKKPGEIVFAGLREISGMSFSTHKLPLRIMFDYLRQSLNCKVLVIGIQPKSLDFDSEPSKEIVKTVKYLTGCLKDILKKA